MKLIEELKKDGIFVVHALKGYDNHGQRLTKLFGELELNFEFVTDGDPIHFTAEVFNKFFTDNIHQYSDGVVSCTLNHIYAYKKIVERGLKYALIFENDPFFLGDFSTKLNKLSDEIAKLPPGYIVSLENTTLTFPSFWQTKTGKKLYPASMGRMAGAYLIDLAGAQNILANLETAKCDAVIDIWHNDLIKRGIINMYWAHPPLVEQGSHNGKMSSTISTKSENSSRKWMWAAQKFYKMYFVRLFNDRRIIRK